MACVGRDPNIMDLGAAVYRALVVRNPLLVGSAKPTLRNGAAGRRARRAIGLHLGELAFKRCHCRVYFIETLLCLICKEVDIALRSHLLISMNFEMVLPTHVAD